MDRKPKRKPECCKHSGFCFSQICMFQKKLWNTPIWLIPEVGNVIYNYTREYNAARTKRPE